MTDRDLTRAELEALTKLGWLGSHDTRDVARQLLRCMDALSGRTFTVDEGREWQSRAEAAEAALATMMKERDAAITQKESSRIAWEAQEAAWEDMDAASADRIAAAEAEIEALVKERDEAWKVAHDATDRGMKAEAEVARLRVIARQGADTVAAVMLLEIAKVLKEHGGAMLTANGGDLGTQAMEFASSMKGDQP